MCRAFARYTYALYLVRNHHLGSISAKTFLHTFRMSHTTLAIRVKAPASLRLWKAYCNASCIQHTLQIGLDHLRLTIELKLMYVFVVLVASFLRLPRVQPRVLIRFVLQES